MSYANALRNMVTDFEVDKLSAQALWTNFESHHHAYRRALEFTPQEVKSLCDVGRWRSSVGLEWDQVGDSLQRTVWVRSAVLSLTLDGRRFVLSARPEISRPKPLVGSVHGLSVVCVSDPLCNAILVHSQPTEINFGLLTEEWQAKVVHALRTEAYIGEESCPGISDCPYDDFLEESEEAHDHATEN